MADSSTVGNSPCTSKDTRKAWSGRVIHNDGAREMNTLAVPGFVVELRKYGTFDANACLNCGSCTVVCNLSDGQASFPRRPLQLALLGLKEPLLAGLEPWLCYDCGECSLTCPRQAEPRESMMTLRRYLSAAYDVTRISSKILTSKIWEIASLVFVGLLVFGLAFFYHLYFVELSVSDLISTPMGLEHMFNIIIYFTYAVFAIPVLILILKAVRMQRLTMRNAGARAPIRLYLIEAKTFLLHLMSQKRMRECVEPIQKKRWAKHWLMVLAFAAKSFIVIFFLKWFQTDSIYPLWNPQRWVGYLIAAILIFFPSEIIVSRARIRQAMHKFSELSDLTLPVMLLLTAVSGIVVHVSRYLEFSMACHYAYAVHVGVATSLVLVELPFGKLSHVMLRPFALYLQAVKERALGEAKIPVERKSSEQLILKGTQPV